VGDGREGAISHWKRRERTQRRRAPAERGREGEEEEKECDGFGNAEIRNKMVV
jgi:hypothetical protein